MVEAIKDAIQKQDSVTTIELETEIAETINMKECEDPKALFDKVSKIRFKCERDDDPSTLIPDEKFIPRIITGVAKQHKGQVAALMSQKKRDNQMLTLKAIKQELETH